MSRTRLDSLLAERGLFESRSRAAAAIGAGRVRLGRDRHCAAKPSQLVAPDVEVAVDRSEPDYVSRGGVKLANALSALGVEVRGRLCLDVGASTGGFTDCLLQRGAAGVVALDVAAGELHPSLRADPRVTVVERANARSLTADALPHRPDLVVVDVSFISLRLVLPAVLACAAPGGFDCLALVKPQFELGRSRVGRGGVVRSAADRREALVSVARFALDSCGAALLGFASSGLPGPAGNRESFAWLGPAGDPRAVQDVEAMAAKVEP